MITLPTKLFVYFFYASQYLVRNKCNTQIEINIILYKKKYIKILLFLEYFVLTNPYNLCSLIQDFL